MEIFTIYLQVVGKFVNTKNCIVMVSCLFRKGVTSVIIVLWMVTESSFNLNSSLPSAMALSRSALQKFHPCYGKRRFSVVFQGTLKACLC